MNTLSLFHNKIEILFTCRSSSAIAVKDRNGSFVGTLSLKLYNVRNFNNIVYLHMSKFATYR